MNLNTYKMREKLEKLKMRQASLRIEATGIAGDIPVLINPTLAEIEDLRVAVAAAKMDDLVMRQAELLRIRGQIWELEEALGQ